MKEMKKPELLLPAGSLPILKTAIRYGADAVYVGGEAFSLRAKADNFTLDELREGIEFAHSKHSSHSNDLNHSPGAKVYLTLNIYARQEDLPGIREYLKELKDIPLDGLLIADPGVFMLARQILPESIPIHISTQANTTNAEGALFWYNQGARRIVLARELSLIEIREIRDVIPDDMDIESFVHGSMCIAYSGRCLLSSYLTGREANRGACTHPCRWKYHVKNLEYSVIEDSRPRQYFPVVEDENGRGTYIFASKDLCMIEHIPELINAGVDSFKIEGRMKSELYVATLARCYRMAIDEYFNDPKLYEMRKSVYREEAEKCTHRPFFTGFYFGNPHEEGQIYGNGNGSSIGSMGSGKLIDAAAEGRKGQGKGEGNVNEGGYERGAVYFGTVQQTESTRNWDAIMYQEKSRKSIYCYFEQKNKFSVGDTLEIMKTNGENISVKVLEIRDALTDTPQSSCPHARQKLKVLLSEIPDEGDLIRGS